MPDLWFLFIVFLALPVVLIVNLALSAKRVGEAERETEKMCVALKEMREELPETERKKIDHVVDTYRNLIRKKPFSTLGKMFAGANIEAARREVEKYYFVHVIGSQVDSEE